MDSFVMFWLGFFLLSTTVCIGVVYLPYWIGKRLGKRKLGFCISSILATAVLAQIFSFVFEDALFSRQEARRKLLEHGIELKNEPEINSNHMSGIRDYTHRFELTISELDKENLKNKILTSESYQDNVPDNFLFWEGKPRYSHNDTTFTISYQTRENYIYEFYKPNTHGIKPIWDKVLLSKSGNKLIYERIQN